MYSVAQPGDYVPFLHHLEKYIETLFKILFETNVQYRITNQIKMQFYILDISVFSFYCTYTIVLAVGVSYLFSILFEAPLTSTHNYANYHSVRIKCILLTDCYETEFDINLSNNIWRIGFICAAVIPFDWDTEWLITRKVIV
ncbi:Uncharacterized protein FWK35_00017851 [Aphis craccivora]|uniref:Uncharacterized protein n=1 Tax=Aphis craccivora TaxID=307492 RepID=A0A6G0ZC84_APHCR|nr:Uncharacterized protein FWK35_00017851 [Aphis craccivora]